MDSFSRQQFSQRHTSVSGSIGESVKVQLRNLAEFVLDEAYARFEQIVDPIRTLGDIDV